MMTKMLVNHCIDYGADDNNNDMIDNDPDGR